MDLSTHWNNRFSINELIALDSEPASSTTDIICFSKDNILVHRNIETYLKNNIPPNDWSILSLSEKANTLSNKSNHRLIDSLSNITAFFIKKTFLLSVKSKILSNVNESIGIDTYLSAINQLVTNKTFYAYRIPLVKEYDMSLASNNDEFYNYYIDKVSESLSDRLNRLITNCKDFIMKNNISMRHMLSELPRYFDPRKLIHILDFKLNIDPEIVNELITISSDMIPRIDILDNLFDYLNYRSSIQKQILHVYNYCDKLIINKFFDKYVYGELPMIIIIPSFNNEQYYTKNLNSVKDQKYSNWRIVYIDDQSIDDTYNLVKKYVIDNHLTNKLKLLQQKNHNAQGCGRFIGYMMADDDEIVCNLDGDDWLYDRNETNGTNDPHCHNALRYVQDAYVSKKYKSTYGCFYKSSGPQWLETKVLYPSDIITNKGYRNYKFLCKHLRTGYAGLYKNIMVDDLIGPDGKFLHMCTDISTQYPVCEMAGSDHGNLLVPTYIYNQDNSVVYNNCWYNLEKKDNEENKQYFETVVKKISSRKPYDTIVDIFIDRYDGFNRFTEKLDIVLHNLSQKDIEYYKSKITHEIGQYMKYEIHEIVGDLRTNDTILFSSNYVLYINLECNKILSNLNPDKYMKWMLKTSIDYVLLDGSINVSNFTNLTTRGSPYDMMIGKIDITAPYSPSGYYTTNQFNNVVINDTGPSNPYSLICRPTTDLTLIVALYNIRKDWVQEAIDSVEKQSDGNYHIIVCDDMTPNLTYKRDVLKYIYEIKDTVFLERMTIIENAINCGLAGTNRTMVGSTESLYIGSLDPDDGLVSNAVKEVRDMYHNDPDADFVYSNFNYCNEKLEFKSKGFSRPLNEKELVLEKNCVSAFRTYKKSTYHKTLGYDDTFKSAEDKDIIFKFEEVGARFKFIPKELYMYRYNATSLARADDGSNAFNNQKTLQYCRDAIRQTYNRRFENQLNITSISLNDLYARYGMKNFDMTNYEKYFNEYFDMVYCINLQDKTNNYNSMVTKLAIAGIKKVTFMRFKYIYECSGFTELCDLIKGSGLLTDYEKAENKKILRNIGELGCLESHNHCIKHALKNGYKRILILEDDVYLDKHFLIKFKEFTDSISNQWKLLLLGTSQWSWWGNAPYIKNNIYHPTRASMGTFAIAVDCSHMRNVVDCLSIYDGPSDLCGYLKSVINRKPNENVHSIIFLKEMRPPIGDCFVAYPSLIVADTRDSELRTPESDKAYYERCESMEWGIDKKLVIKKNTTINNMLINPNNYQTIMVDDYDSIYPDIAPTYAEPITILPSNTLPSEIFDIMIQSKNNKIIIDATNIKGSNLTYYFNRIKKYNNVTIRM
jgi:glycosyltransferase involved in cell wall biosynthesis